jgi:gamma-glutamylcyclotransferase (GGCT)/AIG2-like uncharacterized protein YtfP
MLKPMDEVSLIDKKELKRIDNMLRKNLKIKKKFILLVTTPLGINWFYKYYDKHKKEETCI